MGSALWRSLPVIVVCSDGQEEGWRLTPVAARALVGKAPDPGEVRIQTPGPKPIALLTLDGTLWAANAKNFQIYFGEPV